MGKANFCHNCRTDIDLSALRVKRQVSWLLGSRSDTGEFSVLLTCDAVSLRGGGGGHVPEERRLLPNYY